MVVFIVIIATVYIVTVGTNGEDNSNFVLISDSNEISDSQISIPLNSVGSEAKFYNYPADGLDIHYFAVEGSDNQIHVAVDACDVCYHAKKRL